MDNTSIWSHRRNWRHHPPHRPIFNTHAGWERSSSGRSGSSTDTPILETLNFSGMGDPRRLTDLAPVTSFRRRLRADQCGKIAYRSLPLVVKKASMPAFPGSGFSVNLFTEKPEPGKAGIEAFFTTKGSDLYAILPHWSARSLLLKDVTGAKSVSLLGSPIPLKFKVSKMGVSVELPDLPEELRSQPAWVLKIGR